MMKSLQSKIKLLTLVLAVFASVSAYAQRVITGTVYRDGKPAAGVTVEAHRSSEVFMTSFDGKYKITVDNKCKYLKFTFIDDSRKLDIEENNSNVINFSFDGKIPAEGQKEEAGGVDTRTSQELVNAKITDFMSNYTLEDQFYKQKDYKSALAPWRILFDKYPKSTINIYIHGLNMYESFVESAKNSEERSAYIDTLMTVYNRRIKYFDQRGFVLGRKATDYLKYKLDNQDLSDDQLKAILKEGYATLKESIDLEKNESEIAVLVVYMQVTKRLFIMGQLSKDDVANNYQITSSIIDKDLAKEPSSEKYQTAKSMVDQLFQTSGAADCEALIALYEPQFETISKDVESLKKMLRVLDKQDCTDSELFSKASEKLYALEPSPEAAFNMARLFVKRDDFTKAKEYYENAISSETDKELLSKYYYELGMFTLVKESNYQQARNYARKSVDNNTHFGPAYMLLGDIYAQYAKYYGDNDFEHHTMYWLAVDYYEKAKRVDPDVFANANSKINIYKQYFPDKESLFFQGFQEGQAYTFGSWINESTKARAKK